MNKVAIAAAALLLVVLLALPAVVGAVIEANVRERINAIDENPQASAELTSFDRGWFRSTAKIELELAPDGLAQAAAADGTPLGALRRVPIGVEFAHGPIAMLEGVQFGWYKMIARPDVEVPDVAQLTETLGVPYIFEFRGRSSYFGGLNFDADAPPFVTPVAGGTFTFSGGTLAGTFAREHLTADAQVGAIEITSPTGTFVVRGVVASADNELRYEYVMPGQSSLSIANISVASPGAVPVFDAANLRVQGDVGLDEASELLEVRVDYELESLRVQDNELTAGALALTVRNLDLAAVEAYSAAAADAAAAGDPATIAAALGPHVERAIKAGPSVTLDPIRFRYDGEPFDGRIEVTTNPSRLPPAGTLSLDNPLVLLGLVNTKAELRVSKPLATQLATLGAQMQLGQDPTIPPEQLEYMAEAQSGLMLTMLVGQGVLIEDAEGYRSTLDYTDGALLLNGNPLPFGLP